MPFNADPEGKRLPIKLDSTSNGEFVPIPLDATNRRANRLARRGRVRMPGGESTGGPSWFPRGAASTLLAFNAANAASGRTGGFFELEQVAAVDPAVALDRLGGREFVFDVQGHFVGQHGLGKTGSAVPSNSSRISSWTRHRHDGAVVHSLASGKGAADDPGSR